MKTKIDVICPEHEMFSINPQNHINGQGCKKCADKNKFYTEEEFIKKANKKHNNFYDYSKCEYNGFDKNILIICPNHGKFTQKASNHLRYGCKICGGKDNKETYIKKCNQRWNNKYDYSKTNYLGSHNHIEYICPEHGLVNQKSCGHLRSGCPKCSRIKINKTEFLRRCEILHSGKYDYSNIKSINGINDVVEILCKNHGILKQKVSKHLNGYGCVKCYHDSMKLNIDEFRLRANSIHNFKYDYSNSNLITYNDKIEILCKNHGIFTQLPNHHLRGNGCPICSSSKGEIKIINFLEKNNIEFIKNKRFKDCKFKNELPFDFYLPKHNICIEYDGEMHFKEIQKFGGIDKLKYYQNNDNIKSKYCFDKKINLIRISYNKFNLIESILKTII